MLTCPARVTRFFVFLSMHSMQRLVQLVLYLTRRRNAARNHAEYQLKSRR